MRDAAFTLLEPLVVLVVIAVLAAMVLPVVGTMRGKSDEAAAVRQMSQIGVALAQYTSEHDGQLPGPLWPGQIPAINPGLPSNNMGRLATRLAKYLETDPETRQLVPAFIPPAYKRTMPEAALEDARTYVINMAVVADEIVAPFGNLTLPQGHANREPRRVALIPGNAWAFSDADQQHPRVAGAIWSAFTPAQPVHAQRLAYFFNGSVGRIETAQLQTPTP